MGPEIDAHTAVVRINDAPIRGFEADVGARYMAKETYYVTKETYYMAKETYYVTKETFERF